jgi:hypothetical protein
MVEEATLSVPLDYLGRRHVAIDIRSLCEHLDLLVGAQVAEVIMKHHEVRLGKDAVAEIRKQNTDATTNEIIGKLVEHLQVTGFGTVEAKLTESGRELEITVKNPCVKKTDGSAKSFLFSHWCGALSAMVGGEFEVMHVVYDAQKDLMRGRIVPRPIPKAHAGQSQSRENGAP